MIPKQPQLHSPHWISMHLSSHSPQQLPCFSDFPQGLVIQKALGRLRYMRNETQAHAEVPALEAGREPHPTILTGEPSSLAQAL